MNSPNTPIRRDNKIVAHLFRNSISLQLVIHKLFFPDCQEDATRKVLERLVRKQLVIRYPLFERQSYFRLGRAAIARWNYPPRRGDKLGAQRLPYELGTLALMCLDQQLRKRLTRDELGRLFPWFPPSLMGWAYYLEHSTTPRRLMTVRVETRLRAERIVQKLGQQIRSYAQVPELAHLIDKGGFGVAIVSASPEQEAAIRQECDDFHLPVSVVTAHYPPLIHFL